MSVTLVGVGAASFGTTSATATAPGGSASADTAYLLVASKRTATAPPTPTDWSLRADFIADSGATPAGSGGPFRLQIFKRLVPGGGLSVPAVTHSGTGAVLGVACAVVRPGAGQEILDAVATAEDLDGGGSVSATAGTNPGLESGDLLIALSAVPDNGSSASSATLSATGATLGTTTEHVDASTIDGDDLGQFVHTAAVTAGTATAGPQIVLTLSGGLPLGVVFLRVRGASLSQDVTAPPIASTATVPNGTFEIGPLTISAPPIGSGATVPSGTFAPGPVDITAPAIASTAAVGAGTFFLGTLITGPSIPSTAAVGAGTFDRGPLDITAPPIPSTAGVGEGTFTVTINLARLAGLVDTRQTGYELQCIARIPQQSGPPALLVVDRIKWKGLRYADVLSRPQELAATVQVASISDLVAQRLLGPDRQATELRLLRDGQIVAAGPLAGWHRRGSDVEIVASGLLGYTHRMIVLADLRFDQVDQHLIAAALIDQWQASSYGYGHFGIDTSRVSPSGRLRDRSYVRDEQHKVGQRIEELGAVDGGFDAEVDPTTRQLQLWHPFKGVDRSSGPSAVVLDRRVIASPDVMSSVAPGDLASLAFGTSSSAGSDGGLSSFQVNAELAASFGLSAVMGSWQDISEQATLDDHVRALLDARSHALIVPGPQMRVTPDADLGAYSVGDTVQLELGTDQLGIAGPYRIRKRVVSVAATGVETVDLELV